MQNVKNRLAAELAKECKSMDDVHSLLKELFKDTIQKVLDAEMDVHLGYEKHDPIGDHSSNNRNGYSKKTVQTQMGQTEIKIPRDRNGEFEPQIIKKYGTTANGSRR